MQFDEAIARVLGEEGGLVDNPADPGGLSNWGIALHENPDLTVEAIRAMTRDQACAIYRAKFWDPINGDLLPGDLGWQILDFAVNAGMGTAIRKAQEAAGVADDGHWGPVTRAAVAAIAPALFGLRFATSKLRYYTKLSTFADFGAGWVNRVADDLESVAKDVA
jgi:lysozyme family protein